MGRPQERYTAAEFRRLNASGKLGAAVPDRPVPTPPAQAAAAPPPPPKPSADIPKGNKYGARRVDGFDSAGEARRHAELVLLQQAGRISGLERQKAFPLFCGEVPLMLESATGRSTHARYVADFVYEEDGAKIVEDFKGFDTRVSQLKRAVMATMGYRVRVVRRATGARSASRPAGAKPPRVDGPRRRG